jgi:hypothetical protein
MAQKPCLKAKPALLGRKTQRCEAAHAAPASREQPQDTFQVVILCASEAEQERLYEEFRSRNLSVRLLTI